MSGSREISINTSQQRIEPFDPSTLNKEGLKARIMEKINAGVFEVLAVTQSDPSTKPDQEFLKATGATEEEYKEMSQVDQKPPTKAA